MSTETAKVKAKAKLFIWFALFFCGVVAGLIWEYSRQTRPFDETVLIYKPMGETSAPAIIENVSGGIENIVENQAAKNEQTTEEPQTEYEILQEFLIYMLESQDFLDEDNQHVTVLDKIKQNSPAVEIASPEETAPKVEEKAEETVEKTIEITAEKTIEDATAEKSKDNSAENKTEEPDSEKNTELKVEEKTQNVSNEVVTESEVVTDNKVVDVIPETAPVVEEDDVYPAENLLNFVSDEVRDTIDEIKNTAIEVENAMRENVQAEMQRVEEAGEEAPIILIPGLQNM